MGEKKALDIPAINKWYTELGPDARKEAKKIFGKIGQVHFEKPDDQKTLIKYSVIAFESFRYKNNLQALGDLSSDDLKVFSQLFKDYDDIEATLYYQIIKERVAVISKLQNLVDINSKEKAIQEHVYNHLWLLDTHWERATDNALLEGNVSKEFKEVDVKLTDEEKKARLDIKYKETSGKHVIIELKRASGVYINSYDLAKQVEKYRKALRKCLTAAKREDEPMEVVCILGGKCTDWDTKDDEKRSRDSLAINGIRIVYYGQLIDNALKSYDEYLKQRKEAGRVHELIQKIDES